MYYRKSSTIHLVTITTTIRDDDYDVQEELSIRDRYKNYNNPDGNSPTSEMSDTMNADKYPTSASTSTKC